APAGARGAMGGGPRRPPRRLSPPARADILRRLVADGPGRGRQLATAPRSRPSVAARRAARRRAGRARVRDRPVHGRGFGWAASERLRHRGRPRTTWRRLPGDRVGTDLWRRAAGGVAG